MHPRNAYDINNLLFGVQINSQLQTRLFVPPWLLPTDDRTVTDAGLRPRVQLIDAVALHLN